MTISVSVGTDSIEKSQYCLIYVKLQTSSVCEWVRAQQGLLELGHLQEHLKSPLGELLHQLVKYFVVKSKKSVKQLVPSHLKLVLCPTCSKTSWRARQGIQKLVKHICCSQRHIPCYTPVMTYHISWLHSSMGLIYHSVSGASWSPKRCRLKWPAKMFEKPCALKAKGTLREVDGKALH